MSVTAFERINEICSVKEPAVLSSVNCGNSGIHFLPLESMIFYLRNVSEYVYIHVIMGRKTKLKLTASQAVTM